MMTSSIIRCSWLERVSCASLSTVASAATRSQHVQVVCDALVFTSEVCKGLQAAFRLSPTHTEDCDKIKQSHRPRKVEAGLSFAATQCDVSTKTPCSHCVTGTSLPTLITHNCRAAQQTQCLCINFRKLKPCLRLTNSLSLDLRNSNFIS